MTHNYNPYLDTVHRLNFRTMNLVRDYFNFTMKVRRTRSWGYILNESPMTFDGMVGMVQRGEVDFGCSPAWFKLERHLVIDYGAQTWAIRPIFLFRHPNTRGLGNNLFLEPFAEDVWPVLFICSVLITILMAYTVQQERFLNRRPLLVQMVRLRVLNMVCLPVLRKCQYISTSTGFSCAKPLVKELHTDDNRCNSEHLSKF